MTALRRKSVACLVVTALMNVSLWGQGPAPAVSDQGIAPRIRTALSAIRQVDLSMVSDLRWRRSDAASINIAVGVMAACVTVMLLLRPVFEQ